MATADSVVDLESVFSSVEFFNELHTENRPSVTDLTERHNKQQRQYKGCCFMILVSSIYICLLM